MKNNRRGDILYLFFLSMVTERHTYVHLKNSVMWSALKAVPTNHDEHVSRCALHLVYLGFRAFLCLKPHQIIDVKEIPILGHITSDDPDVTRELIKRAVKQEKLDDTGMAPGSMTATAAAGSAAQLERMEAELKDIPLEASANWKPIAGTLTGTPLATSPVHHVPQVTTNHFLSNLLDCQKPKFGSTLVLKPCKRPNSSTAQ